MVVLVVLQVAVRFEKAGGRRRDMHVYGSSVFAPRSTPLGGSVQCSGRLGSPPSGLARPSAAATVPLVDRRRNAAAWLDRDGH